MKACITLLLAAVCALFATHSRAQTNFHRGYFDPAGIRSFSSGGVLAEAGNGDFIYSFSGPGLMRTGNTGVPLWIRDYTANAGGAVQRFLISQAIPLPGGDLMLFGKLPNASSLRDTFLMARTTGAGVPVWAKMLPLTSPQTMQHRRAILCANGDILLCTSQSGQAPNYTVATRMDAAGNIHWQHLYLNYSNPSVARQFYVWDVAECANGDFVIGGFGSPPTDNMITRISSMGAVVWSRKLDYPGGSMGRPWRVRELPGGQIRVIIDNPMPNGWGKGYITLDAGGNVTGAGKAFKMFSFSDAQILPSGDMLYSTGTASLLRVSNGGSVLFANRYGDAVSNLVLSAVCPTADGGFAAAGSYYSGSFPSTLGKGYLLKTASTGAARPFDAAITIADTPYANTATAITVFDSVVTIPLAAVSLSQSPVVVQDTLFALTLSVPFTGGERGPALYPNPARNTVYFSTGEAYDACVYAADGSLVLDRRNTRQLDVSGLAAGLYFVQLTDERGRIRAFQRLLKE